MYNAEVRGRELTLVAISGKITGTSRRTDQEVYSEGGSGRVRTGFWGTTKVDMPKIKTINTKMTEFFIKSSRGQEFHIDTQVEVAIRDGHNVTLLSTVNQNNSIQKELFLINHDTGKLSPLIMMPDIPAMGLAPKYLTINYALYPIFGIAVGVALNSATIGLLAFFGAIGVKYFHNKSVKKKQQTAVNELFQIANGLNEQYSSDFIGLAEQTRL